MGLKGARARGSSGVSSSLFVPLNASSLQTWAIGSTLSYYHFFTPIVGLGGELSYLYALASMPFPGGNGFSETPDFHILDLALSLQVRMF